VNGGTISNSHTFAVHAHEGGSIMLAGGVLVTDTGFHAVVAQNAGSGVEVGVGSTLAMQRATIKQNGGHGIHLAGTSSAAFGGGDNTITGNGGWGITCDGPPAVAQIQVGQGIGDVSGNAAGQISCPTT
jgi:hypothetical protein